MRSSRSSRRSPSTPATLPVHQHAQPVHRGQAPRPADRRAALRAGEGAAGPAAAVEVEPGRFVLIDQVIAANLDALFPGMEIVETHLFRVTRNADLAIEEDEADDLLLAIEEELRRRRFGEAVRLEVERSMPADDARDPAARASASRDEDCYEIAGMLDLHRARPSSLDLDRPDLKVAALDARSIPARLVPPDEDEPIDVFAAIRTGDLLVHHPYESFSASTERFVAQAADDPDVLSIKQTLYRTSRRLAHRPRAHPRRRERQAGRGPGRDQGPLRRGGEHRLGAHAWSRRAPTSCMASWASRPTRRSRLVVRREGNGLRRYVHIGTGNYNAEDRPAVRRPGPAVVPRRSWAPTSPTCSTS